MTYCKKQVIRRKAFPPPSLEDSPGPFVIRGGEGPLIKGDKIPRGERKVIRILKNLGGSSLVKERRIPSDGLPVGGRLRNFFPAWENISRNCWILDVIKNGLKLEFLTLPPTRFIVTGYHPTSQGRAALLSEVQSLILKEVLVPVPKDQEGLGFYSNLFLIKKPNGSYRTIINLKHLNVYLDCPSFRMETLKTTAALLFQDCFMVTLDLKDAYYHVPIHVNHQKYLRVAINMNSELCHFQFQAMPFGLAIAPRVFTKIVTEMAAHIREAPGIFVPYLDDFLLVGSSLLRVEAQLARVRDILGKLGWQINEDKSVLVPSQVRQFLGITVDSRAQKFFLPTSKIEAIKKLIEPLLLDPLTSIRKAMSLLGQMTATIPAVTWAQIRSRPLQWQTLESWDGNSSSLDDPLRLSPDTIQSLRWWLVGRNLTEGKSWRLERVRVLTTDASGTGWGAHLADLSFQGKWAAGEGRKSSNYRELLAVLLGLQATKERLKSHHVQVQSDNATTVAYLNKQGGTRSAELLDLSFQIFALAEQYFLSLSAVFLRGVENIQADYLSRQTLRQGDWTLNREIFQKIVRLWGLPQIDLFSSKENRQVELFCSLNPLDHPWAVDALAVPWRWELAYAFPPIPLIPRVLKKVREDQAELILIAPFWPKRAWFSLLRDMSIGDPWVLPEVRDLLSQGPVLHPQVKNLHLTAWRLKGRF